MRHASLMRRCLARPRLLLLTLCAALSTIGMGLSLANMWGGTFLAQHWDTGPARMALILLPTEHPPPSAELLQHFSEIPGASHVRSLSPVEVNTLLTQWNAPWPSPVPPIITLNYTGTPSRLEQNVKETLPTATLIAPPQQRSSIPSFTAIIYPASLLSALIGTLTSGAVLIASIVLSAQSARLTQNADLELLAQLGCPLHRAYWTTTVRFGMSCCIGSVLGLLLLFPMLYALIALLSPLMHQAPPQVSLLFDVSHPSWLHFLYLLPLFYAVLGWMVSEFFYYTSLRAPLP